MVKPMDETMPARVTEGVRQCPRGELLARIRQVEEAVARGTAQMRDFEMFVCCQKELLRREILYSSPERASKP